MNIRGLHGCHAETASRVCPVVFVPATSTRTPAISPVTAMKLKPTAKENAVTIMGRMIAPNAPPTWPIPSVRAKPELLALVG